MPGAVEPGRNQAGNRVSRVQRNTRTEQLLIVADSEHDANMLYAVPMFAPEPFIYLRLKGKCHVVMDDLEIDRAREEAGHCRVLSLSNCLEKLRREGLRKPGLAHVIQRLLRSKNLGRVFVPSSFPLSLADALRRLDIRVKVKADPFFAGREFKTAEEVKKISAALIMAEVGLAEGIQALRSAKVGKNGRLIYHNVPFTAEKLRAIIATAAMQAGGVASHTIVACGRQSCFPHQEGHGVLHANEPIILNVFPRSQKTGYYGDISRTVVKGRASEAIRKLYHTVRRGQEIGFRFLHAKCPARKVHQEIQSFFDQEGYKTCRRNGRMQGFLHGSGHGLGLQLREPPQLGPTSADHLRIGHVVTLEPGLYCPELGGIRLEDVVWITRNGPRNLTRFEKTLET